MKKHFAQKSWKFPRWLKILSRAFLAIVLLVISGYIFMAWYVNSHKSEILTSITAELNESINGTLTVESMEPAFLEGFPQFSLNLKNVTIRDTLYKIHKKSLLQAEDLDISVNMLALLHGNIEIKKISITNGEVNLFTDENGYSNGSVFKKGEKKPDGSNATYPDLKKFTLNNVRFGIDNLHKKKRYQFNIDQLKGKVDFDFSDWKADVSVKLLAKSMAFNTKKGSFLKDKIVDGTFEIEYNEDKSQIEFLPKNLEIGGEDFTVSAQFQIGQPTAKFSIKIENKDILWKNASVLLAPNISSRLDLFKLSEPIAVTCDIVGDFNDEGDPLIHVKAKIRDNTLDTPGGRVDNCDFDGEFTNNHVASKGFNDANSAVKLFNFTGNYAEIPINMKQVFILDFENPYAVGDFTSEFDISKINNLVDSDLLIFSKGTAKVNLQYKADIVNYKLTKPLVQGLVDIKNADVRYVSRNLLFKDISVGLHFEKDNLSISKINFKSGKSIVNMEGNIHNFLNLYYTDPEKMVLNWQIYSPQLYLGEFMGFISSKKKGKVVKRKTATGNFTEELNTLFDRSNVAVNLKVDKLVYNKFYATNAVADLFLTDSGIVLKNGGLRHAGGTISVNGTMNQQGKTNSYALNSVVSKVNVSQFFKSFSNFGLESLKAENLKGFLSAKTNLTGRITDQGALVPNTLQGNVVFNFQKGALVNFDAVKNVGKFAFPFRDLNNIQISELDGEFNINREKVTINPMQINSSVLNMDIEGVYSFGSGTEIFVDVPLRNPKKDKNVTDEAELAKRRNRGIVLHLIAADGDDGKVKVKLGGKRK